MDLNQILSSNGWFQGRKVTISADISTYPQFAKSFLTEFGGLKIKYPVDRSPDYFFIIDPEECDDTYVHFGEQIGKSLFPIGTEERRGMDLVVDSEGYLYSLGSVYVCYGKDLEESLFRAITLFDQDKTLAFNPISKKWEDNFSNEQNFEDFFKKL